VRDVLHLPLRTQRPEFAISFATDAGSWTLPHTLPVLSGRLPSDLQQVAPLERFQLSNRFLSSFPPILAARLVRQLRLLLPGCRWNAPVALAQHPTRPLFLPSTATDSFERTPVVALTPAAASLLAIPVWTNPRPAAPSRSPRIESAEMRPTRGKLHLGFAPRLERETEIRKWSYSEVLMELLTPHMPAPGGVIDLPLPQKRAPQESRMEPAPACRLQPASIFISPALAVPVSGMPVSPSVDPHIFPHSLAGVPVFEQIPEPSITATHPFLGYFAGSAGALHLRALPFQGISDLRKDWRRPAAAPEPSDSMDPLAGPQKPSILRHVLELRPARAAQFSTSLTISGAPEYRSRNRRPILPRQSAYKENRAYADPIRSTG
jgi:hypothetical protein